MRTVLGYSGRWLIEDGIEKKVDPLVSLLEATTNLFPSSDSLRIFDELTLSKSINISENISIVAEIDTIISEYDLISYFL